MKNTASKKETCLGFLLIVFLAYVVCYLLSQTVFHEIYLFEWTAAHYYLCVWVASVTFCFLEMYKAALITTAGNWAGILIGQTSVYKGYKQDKIEMRGDRAEMSDFPLYLNTVAGGLDRRDQTIGGFSFVVKIYAVPVVEIIG